MPTHSRTQLSAPTGPAAFFERTGLLKSQAFEPYTRGPLFYRTSKENMDYIELNDLRLPALGLGTWQLTDEACRRTVAQALKMGYRHLDTATAYGNESEVGAGLKDSGVDRNACWITSKVWYEDLTPAAVMRSCRETVQRLGVERVDLMLVHWPSPDVPLADTLAALQQAVEAGLTRHFGVSNFPAGLLQKAVDLAPVRCIQVECHPYMQQARLREIARERNLLFTAYSPLARGRVLDDQVLTAIGRKHEKSPAQVALRYLLQQPGLAVIPKASSEAHLRSNLEVFDFELSEEELAQVASLNRDERLIDPSFAPDWEA